MNDEIFQSIHRVLQMPGKFFFSIPKGQFSFLWELYIRWILLENCFFILSGHSIISIISTISTISGKVGQYLTKSNVRVPSRNWGESLRLEYSWETGSVSQPNFVCKMRLIVDIVILLVHSAVGWNGLQNISLLWKIHRRLIGEIQYWIWITETLWIVDRNLLKTRSQEWTAQSVDIQSIQSNRYVQSIHWICWNSVSPISRSEYALSILDFLISFGGSIAFLRD
jgi:hypothetical protein